MQVEPWLVRAAAAHPERTAVETPAGSLTYAALERASRSALRPGERVALALPPGLDFAVALHACLRAGAVAIPVDLRLSDRERARASAAAQTVIEAPLRGSASGPSSTAPRMEAPAAIIHTSGSSGAPKAVELSYGNWLWNALGSATALGLDRAERWLCALPLAHVGGLSILIRSAIYATSAVIHERFDAAAVLEALMRGEATIVSLVPTTLARLLDAGLERPPALRCALVGGAPVAPALLERAAAAGVPVSQTYGLTEACSQVTMQAPGDGGADAGPPLFCTRVRIAGDGEILVAGPTVAGGGWLRTGDLGELRDGRLRVTGRKRDVIVSGGENVAPAEVEAVLSAHGAVREAAVVGFAHPEWGEAVRAVVVLDRPASAEELRAHCAARLAAFKVPKEIVFATGPLPRTRSGQAAPPSAMSDADDHRAQSRESWERAAAGWRRRREMVSEMGAPVSGWMIDAARLQPGHHVLELAAGPGETGLLAAELVRPGGTLICSDQAEAMLAVARERAAELGIENVEFKVIDAEWIDLPLASVDAALCRWGYMLMADPAAALRETRRVLRPGGRVALAVWDAIAVNPWFAVPGAELLARGVVTPPEPGGPGPFALGDRDRVRGLLEEAGFQDIEIDALDLQHLHADFDAWWENTLDLSTVVSDALERLDPPAVEDLKAALRERLAPYTDADGRIELDARTLVAAASA